LVCVLCTAGAAPATPGETPTFPLEVRGEGFRRVSVQVTAAQMDAAAQGFKRDVFEAQETLARDLIYTGFFYVMDSDAGPFLPRGVSRAWNAANERPGERPHRIESRWTAEGGRLAVEMRLLDGAGGQVVGKRYAVTEAGVRAVMHHFADQVVHTLTGFTGIAQTQIAFARLQGKNSEIWTVDYDGFGEKQVTAQRSLTLSPCWGTNRSWIAFTSYAEGQPWLYRLDQGSRRLRAVSAHPGLNTSPEWSSGRGAFALTLTRDGNAEVYSMDRDGGGLKRLTHHPGIDTSPTWSATGQQIAFTSDRSGAPQIFVMDADGGNVRRLTRHGLYSDAAAWSPDGQWIAYVCRREGEFQLCVVRPDGGDERVVVRDGLNDAPSWANDSRHLAFSSRRGGARAVYVVDLYSGLERRLSSGSLEAITPAWSSR
jgi:TolB protein